MRLRYEWDNTELVALNTEILVQMWEHKRYGRVRRAYHAAFTEEEQKRIAQLHTLVVSWHEFRFTRYENRGWGQGLAPLTVYGTGTPDWHHFDVATINLIRRAVHFFATEGGQS